MTSLYLNFSVHTSVNVHIVLVMFFVLYFWKALGHGLCTYCTYCTPFF